MNLFSIFNKRIRARCRFHSIKSHFAVSLRGKSDLNLVESVKEWKECKSNTKGVEKKPLKFAPLQLEKTNMKELQNKVKSKNSFGVSDYLEILSNTREGKSLDLKSKNSKLSSENFSEIFSEFVNELSAEQAFCFFCSKSSKAFKLHEMSPSNITLLYNKSKIYTEENKNQNKRTENETKTKNTNRSVKKANAANIERQIKLLLGCQQYHHVDLILCDHIAEQLVFNFTSIHKSLLSSALYALSNLEYAPSEQFLVKIAGQIIHSSPNQKKILYLYFLAVSKLENVYFLRTKFQFVEELEDFYAFFSSKCRIIIKQFSISELSFIAIGLLKAKYYDAELLSVLGNEMILQINNFMDGLTNSAKPNSTSPQQLAKSFTTILKSVSKFHYILACFDLKLPEFTAFAHEFIKKLHEKIIQDGRNMKFDAFFLTSLIWSFTFFYSSSQCSDYETEKLTQDPVPIDQITSRESLKEIIQHLLRLTVDVCKKQKTTLSFEDYTNIYQSYLYLAGDPELSLIFPKKIIERGEELWKSLFLEDKIITKAHQEVLKIIKDFKISNLAKITFEDTHDMISKDIGIYLKNGRKIGIEVNGPTHFARNSENMFGYFIFHQRILENKGWQIININYYDWILLKTEQKQSFLFDLLTKLYHISITQ